MSKVILKGHIVVPDNELSIVSKELKNYIELTRQEKGCLIFQVTQSGEKKNQFDVYEEFSEREAFELHQNRVKASRWGQISQNVERHYQVTETE